MKGFQFLGFYPFPIRGSNPKSNSRLHHFEFFQISKFECSSLKSLCVFAVRNFASKQEDYGIIIIISWRNNSNKNNTLFALLHKVIMPDNSVNIGRMGSNSLPVHFFSSFKWRNRNFHISTLSRSTGSKVTIWPWKYRTMSNVRMPLERQWPLFIHDFLNRNSTSNSLRDICFLI